MQSAHGARRGGASAAAGGAVGAVLAGLAALRRGKAVHPDGVVHEARLRPFGSPDAPRGTPLLGEPGEHRALARFSRSLGLPRPIPDLLGMSIRVLDAHGPGRHQDLLLVTSGDLPILHHLFLPATDVQQRPYTSSLPYRAGQERFLVGALPDPTSARPAGRDEFDRLAAAAATGALRFRLAVAPVFGRFRPVAELAIGRELPRELDSLRFNPIANSGPGFEPLGFLNGMRDAAYRASQAAWRASRDDGATRQDGADARVRSLGGAPGQP
jgi:hypothetical protein